MNNETFDKGTVRAEVCDAGVQPGADHYQLLDFLPGRAALVQLQLHLPTRRLLRQSNRN